MEGITVIVSSRRVDTEEEYFVAAPIIKEIVYDILKANPNESMPLRFLKDVVQEKSGREFSNGSFSGAMRDLVEEFNGRIINASRGFYVYIEDLKKYQINHAINKLMDELNAIATDNILELTEKDINSIREIPRLKEGLRRLFL